MGEKIWKISQKKMILERKRIYRQKNRDRINEYKRVYWRKKQIKKRRSQFIMSKSNNKFIIDFN